MSVKYKPDSKGFRRFARSADLQGTMMGAARIVESAARALPVEGRGSEADKAGYRGAFRSAPTLAKIKGGSGERAAAMVINDHEMEHIFGGKGRTLYRALDALKGVKIT